MSTSYISPDQGRGNSNITINIGENTSRSQRTKRFTLSGDYGVSGSNAMVINQNAAELAIGITGQSSATRTEGDSGSVVFEGWANGAILGFTVSSGVTAILTENSNTSTPNTISGESQVSIFGDKYTFEVTINTLPSSGTYTIVVSTKDTQGGTPQSVTYTLTVNSSGGGTPDVTSVDLDPNELTLAPGDYDDLTVTVSPAGANQNVSLQSTDSTVATATIVNGGVRVTATNHNGDYSGNCRIIARSVENSNKYDACDVSVYSTGRLYMAQDTIWKTSITDGANVEFEGVNVDVTTLDATVTNISGNWLTFGNPKIITTGTPYIVSINTQTNTSDGATARTATITITGKDMLGNNLTKTFTYTQGAPSSDDIPCESMLIYPSGTVTLDSPENTRRFDLSYSPNTTTQHACTWSLIDDSTGTEASTSVAELEEDDDPNLGDVRYVVVHADAVLKLQATNAYTTSGAVGPVSSNIVTINATYNPPPSPSQGVINVSDDNITLSAMDDRCDTTNGAPSVSGTNLVGSVEVASFTGFISTAYISGGILYTTFPYNGDAQQKQGTVVLRDSGDYNVTRTVYYTQLAYVDPGNNEIRVIAVEGVPSPTAPTSVKFVAEFVNKQITQQTFSQIYGTIVGKDSNDEVRFTKSGVTLSPSSISPYARETVTQIFEVTSVEPTGAVVKYEVTVSATCMSQLIYSDTYISDGTDDTSTPEEDPDVH